MLVPAWSDREEMRPLCPRLFQLPRRRMHRSVSEDSAGHIHSLGLGSVTVCSSGFPEIKGQQIYDIKYLT